MSMYPVNSVLRCSKAEFNPLIVLALDQLPGNLLSNQEVIESLGKNSQTLTAAAPRTGIGTILSERLYIVSLIATLERNFGSFSACIAFSGIF